MKIGIAYSEESRLEYGVAQGSVLDQICLISTLDRYGSVLIIQHFTIFGFADYHQLLKTFLPLFQINALDGDINYCLNLISDWMNNFFLQLNASKTKILVIVPPSLRNTVRIQGTFINNMAFDLYTQRKI